MATALTTSEISDILDGKVNRYLSLHEVAQILGVHYNTVLRYSDARKITVTRLTPGKPVVKSRQLLKDLENLTIKAID